MAARLDAQDIAPLDDLRATEGPEWPRYLRGADLLRVSVSELDTLVEIAVDAPGVYGARLTGAGSDNHEESPR